MLLLYWYGVSPFAENLVSVSIILYSAFSVLENQSLGIQKHQSTRCALNDAVTACWSGVSPFSQFLSFHQRFDSTVHPPPTPPPFLIRFSSYWPPGEAALTV